MLINISNIQQIKDIWDTYAHADKQIYFSRTRRTNIGALWIKLTDTLTLQAWQHLIYLVTMVANHGKFSTIKNRVAWKVQQATYFARNTKYFIFSINWRWRFWCRWGILLVILVKSVKWRRWRVCWCGHCNPAYATQNQILNQHNFLAFPF